MKMVRKQIYIEAEQNQKLKRLAAELGLSEAEVLRRGLDLLGASSDEYRAGGEGARGLQVREVATLSYGVRDMQAHEQNDELQGRVLDHQAWLEELAFIKERARTVSASGSAGRWNREEAYDRRRLRLPD